MKFSDFLFPESKVPAGDYNVITESLSEAQLCDKLGFDTVWLAEHHFDGGCAYVDPMTFASAIASSTNNIRIGFAVAQMALHHPIRFAEQVSLIDNISKGRITVGVGKGSAYNYYEFRGFGVDPSESIERLSEVEEILSKVWTNDNFKHSGKFWNIDLPSLRPAVYQKPHPPVLRACSGEESVREMAKQNRPFLMNIQTNEVTKNRIDAYRHTMQSCKFDDEQIDYNLSNSWAWRNIVVADTDKEAEEIGVSSFLNMRKFLTTNREKYNTQQEISDQIAATSKRALDSVEDGLLYGSPETICEKLKMIDDTGIGGMIIHFRLGDMSWETAQHSIELFANKVMPEFT
jgi:alkanesulfonate monooxygenase SsuD/methylene tetrahydromethanopterin reductase-like flavin-dependent oxidoreductase (luciferase family)